MNHRLLVICRSPRDRSFLEELFKGAGDFLVRGEESGEKGLECAFDWDPGLVLVGQDLPGVSGLTVTRLLKGDPRTRHIPVVSVSDSASDAAVIESLRAGADEHVALPGSPEPILWRVRAVLRRFERAGSSPPETLRSESLLVVPEERAVFVAGREIELRKKEFELLEAFLRRPGRVLTRRFLLETVWGFDAGASPRSVDIHVARLRRKLGAPVRRSLVTVHGLGYRWRAARLAGFDRAGSRAQGSKR